MPRITLSQLHQKMAVEGTCILIVSGSGGTEKGGMAIVSGGIRIKGRRARGTSSTLPVFCSAIAKAIRDTDKHLSLDLKRQAGAGSVVRNRSRNRSHTSGAIAAAGAILRP